MAARTQPRLDLALGIGVLRLAAGLLILKVTFSVVLKYRDYLPPDFDSEFLQGRETYFWNGYNWAFYGHLAAGPLSLVLGTVLVSERVRRRFPTMHRVLGRIQVIDVLFCVVPTGLAMAFRAQGGPIAGWGLATLAFVTAFTVVQGWCAAVQRRFAAHRQWMWRCYLSLCSTVVLRLVMGISMTLGVDPPWLDAAVPWISWAAPLAVYEASVAVRRHVDRGWKGASSTSADV